MALDNPYDEISYSDLEDLRYISRGNFGQIYRASYFGTDVAVKQLLDIGNQLMHKYIEREMSLLMSLRHPHIVQFMGLCKHEHELFIITEYVDGGDLYDKLRDPSVNLPWKTKVKILTQACQAVCYLHSRGVIHRDLKSQNLLVDSSFRIKICDFGFARAADSKEYMTMCGTDEWMAPEVILGDKYDESADVFSFGVIIAELITGRDPPSRVAGNAYAFDIDVLKKQMSADCPPELYDICAACCKFFPEERPAMKDVLNRLRTMEKSLPESEGVINLAEDLTYMQIEGAAPTESPEPSKRKRRHKKKEGEGSGSSTTTTTTDTSNGETRTTTTTTITTATTPGGEDGEKKRRKKKDVGDGSSSSDRESKRKRKHKKDDEDASPESKERRAARRKAREKRKSTTDSKPVQLEEVSQTDKPETCST